MNKKENKSIKWKEENQETKEDICKSPHKRENIKCASLLRPEDFFNGTPKGAWPHPWPFKSSFQLQNRTSKPG